MALVFPRERLASVHLRGTETRGVDSSKGRQTPTIICAPQLQCGCMVRVLDAELKVILLQNSKPAKIFRLDVSYHLVPKAGKKLIFCWPQIVLQAQDIATKSLTRGAGKGLHRKHGLVEAGKKDCQALCACLRVPQGLTLPQPMQSQACSWPQYILRQTLLDRHGHHTPCVVVCALQRILAKLLLAYGHTLVQRHSLGQQRRQPA